MIYDLSDVAPELRDYILESPRLVRGFEKLPTKLFETGSDAKTVKGEKWNILTGVQYLTPAKGSGVQLCAMAGLAGCERPCLNISGRAEAFADILAWRLRKTLMFTQHTEAYLDLFENDVRRVIRAAERKNMVPAIRANGTSDVQWEKYGLPQLFPDTTFYDYTKIGGRKVPDNYDLTLSYSEVSEAYVKYFAKHAENMRWAVVFGGGFPKEFKGRRVVRGDDNDLRFLDDQDVVVALKPKGRAKKDDTGFVIRDHESDTEFKGIPVRKAA